MEKTNRKKKIWDESPIFIFLENFSVTREEPTNFDRGIRGIDDHSENSLFRNTSL